MKPVYNQIMSKCREATGGGRLSLHLVGRKPEDPSISTLLPMLTGSIVIVIIGVVVSLIVG